MPDPDAIVSYWMQRLASLDLAHVPCQRSPLPLHANEFSMTWRLEWPVNATETVFAVLSMPLAPGPHPALLAIPPYGSAAHVASYEIRRHFITLTLRHRGMRLTRSEVPAEFPGFLTAGIESIDSFGFARVLEDCVLAALFLSALPETADRPLLCRGHEFALLTAALVPAVTHVICQLGLWHRLPEMATPSSPYPLAEIADYLRRHPAAAPRVWQTLSWFEPLAFAPRIQAATLLVTDDERGRLTPAMGREILSAMPTDETAQWLYETQHSAARDSRHIYEWMAQQCGLRDPMLPVQWT